MRVGVFALVNTVLWGVFTLIGYSIITSAYAENRADFPSHGQVEWYLVQPLFATILSLVLFTAALYPKPAIISAILNVLSLLANIGIFFWLLSFFFSYTGGV